MYFLNFVGQTEFQFDPFDFRAPTNLTSLIEIGNRQTDRRICAQIDSKA
jgi:hypothetical protein